MLFKFCCESLIRFWTTQPCITSTNSDYQSFNTKIHGDHFIFEADAPKHSVKVLTTFLWKLYRFFQRSHPLFPKNHNRFQGYPMARVGLTNFKWLLRCWNRLWINWIENLFVIMGHDNVFILVKWSNHHQCWLSAICQSFWLWIKVVQRNSIPWCGCGKNQQ
jgi:hypothetical protein